MSEPPAPKMPEPAPVQDAPEPQRESSGKGTALLLAAPFIFLGLLALFFLLFTDVQLH